MMMIIFKIANNFILLWLYYNSIVTFSDAERRRLEWLLSIHEQVWRVRVDAVKSYHDV
jgi:hypothetical protein